MSGAAGRRGSLQRWADAVDGGDDEECVHEFPDSSAWAAKGDWEAPIEHWISHYSEELATAWHILKEYCESQGLPFLENATFTDFAEFVFKLSSKRM